MIDPTPLTVRRLCGDWHLLLPTPVAAVVLSVVAVIGGSLLGAERERKGKSVGFRTLTLVSLGAATFTQLSTALGGHDGQGARVIAAQVVSGVGFLGAGAIMRGNVGVMGLTSAATIWVMAAVDMTAGADYGGATLVLSWLIVAVLTFISALEQRYIGPCNYTSARVYFRGKGRVKVEELLDKSRVLPANRQWEASATNNGANAATGSEPGGPSAEASVMVHFCFVHLQHKEFLFRLACMAEVVEIIPEDPARLAARTESVKAGFHVGPRKGH